MANGRSVLLVKNQCLFVKYLHDGMLDNMKILGVEHKWFERGVNEAIHIWALKPSLNRDGGRYNPLPIWNNIIKERLMKSITGKTTEGVGGPIWGILLAFPVVSNTIQRWHHTEEGNRDSRKLCNWQSLYYPVIVVKTFAYIHKPGQMSLHSTVNISLRKNHRYVSHC